MGSTAIRRRKEITECPPYSKTAPAAFALSKMKIVPGDLGRIEIQEPSVFLLIQKRESSGRKRSKNSRQFQLFYFFYSSSGYFQGCQGSVSHPSIQTFSFFFLVPFSVGTFLFGIILLCISQLVMYYSYYRARER